MRRMSLPARRVIATSMRSCKACCWKGRHRERGRSSPEHLDHRHDGGVQDGHLALGIAAAHPCALAVPRCLPDAGQHRRVDPSCARPRLSRRVGYPHAPQSVPRNRRSHLSPSLRNCGNRASFDESLAICRLERYVGDLALAEGWTFETAPVERTEHIAVVGGGPSGLSAAFHLRQLGYAVTLIESAAELGGLMRYGIPPYRLARSVLDAEIDRIVALGIDVRCGAALATPAEFERLRAEYDAVYLAIGARRQKRLPQLDYTRPWVMEGADYLARANGGAPPALGRPVFTADRKAAYIKAPMPGRHGIN